MPRTKKQSSEAAVRDIRRPSAGGFPRKEKIRIVLDGLRGELSVAELCRREGIATNLYYRWSKDFLEAGKKRLSGDTVREARARKRSRACGPRTASWKEVVAEMTLKNRVLRKKV